MMKIGELARSTGTTVKTIRFYEDAGLMPPPPRTESGYRVYISEDAHRLAFIRKAKRLGMSLDEIKSVLQLHDRNQPTCIHVRSLFDDKIAQIDQAVKEMQGFREELTVLRDEAGELVDCHPTGGNVCGIVERTELALDEGSMAWLGSHWPRRS